MLIVAWIVMLVKSLVAKNAKKVDFATYKCYNFLRGDTMNEETIQTSLSGAIKSGWDSGKEFNKKIQDRKKLVTNRLKKLRFEKDISQSDLCIATGINRLNYSNYETEKASPSIEVLVRLADYYDVSLDYICGRTNKRQGLYVEAQDNSEQVKKDIQALKEQLADIQGRITEIEEA